MECLTGEEEEMRLFVTERFEGAGVGVRRGGRCGRGERGGGVGVG